jgi:precorrin-6A/cobalt-precorrin-6A reductase
MPSPITRVRHDFPHLFLGSMMAGLRSAGHVLILGGTAEARWLAGELAGYPGLRVTTSLAGRVAEPRLPAGEVRTGGFGGVDGLTRWLRVQGVDALVDATHPFAEAMSFNAARAAEAAGVALVALRRPGWVAGPGDRWVSVASLTAAAARLPCLGTRVFLSVGRQGLAAFAGLTELWFLVRTVDPPAPPMPPKTHVILGRGPYAVEREMALLGEHGIDVVVTKDSGGEASAAKLVAARELGVPVVIIRRPPALHGVAVVADVAGALGWLSRRLGWCA